VKVDFAFQGQSWVRARDAFRVVGAPEPDAERQRVARQLQWR
jgi:hypothetical protein